MHRTERERIHQTVCTDGVKPPSGRRRWGQAGGGCCGLPPAGGSLSAFLQRDGDAALVLGHNFRGVDQRRAWTGSSRGRASGAWFGLRGGWEGGWEASGTRNKVSALTSSNPRNPWSFDTHAHTERAARREKKAAMGRRGDRSWRGGAGSVGCAGPMDAGRWADPHGHASPRERQRQLDGDGGGGRARGK